MLMEDTKAAARARLSGRLEGVRPPPIRTRPPTAVSPENHRQRRKICIFITLVLVVTYSFFRNSQKIRKKDPGPNYFKECLTLDWKNPMQFIRFMNLMNESRAKHNFNQIRTALQYHTTLYLLLKHSPIFLIIDQLKLSPSLGILKHSPSSYFELDWSGYQ